MDSKDEEVRLPLKRRLLRTLAGAGLLLSMLVGTAQAQLLAIDGVQIVMVRQPDPASALRVMRFEVTDCHAIFIPPEPPASGGLLEVLQADTEIVVRVGFGPSAVMFPCGSPTQPTVYEVPIGELGPGNYTVQLIGVHTVSPGREEYDLDTFSFVVPAPPRTIPAAVGVAFTLLGTVLAGIAFVQLRPR